MRAAPAARSGVGVSFTRGWGGAAAPARVRPRRAGLPARLLRIGLVAGVTLGLAARLDAQGLPSSRLALLDAGEWNVWWRSGDAPSRWSRDLAAVAGRVEWRPLRPGADVAEIQLAADGVAWRLNVVLVRLSPESFDLHLDGALRDGGLRGDWSVDSAPAEAVVAVNAGQFSGGQPWGWQVRQGREIAPPGDGPLSMALVMDSAGGARLVPADSIAAVRAAGGVREAFQSYPALLVDDGAVPPQLRAPGRGVDLSHRDARLALGELRDGRILLALTRFGGLGEAGGGLPFGPTTPEMAALMGALGCREAVLLDGGLSGQLLLRGEAGERRAWKGWRRVPLGLIASPAPRPSR